MDVVVLVEGIFYFVLVVVVLVDVDVDVLELEDAAVVDKGSEVAMDGLVKIFVEYDTLLLFIDSSETEPIPLSLIDFVVI